MTLLLDTSAVIGWFERRNQRTIELLLADGETPMVHAVTLGELADGWQRAQAGASSARIVASRLSTYSTVRDEFVICRDMDAETYAAVSIAARRSLSHNDLWIVAAARTLGVPLLTEDLDVVALHGLDVLGEPLDIHAV